MVIAFCVRVKSENGIAAYVNIVNANRKLCARFNRFRVLPTSFSSLSIMFTLFMYNNYSQMEMARIYYIYFASAKAFFFLTIHIVIPYNTNKISVDMLL